MESGSPCRAVHCQKCQVQSLRSWSPTCFKRKRKNVHAVIVGEELNQITYSKVPNASVTYNPYKAKTFVDERKNPIHEAEIVVIRGNKNGYVIFAE